MRIFSKSIALCAALGLASVGGTASAHHSAAQFDATKCIVLKGKVRTFEWRFPHSWLWVIVTDKSGREDIWGLEMPAPSQLIQIDGKWRKSSLVPGQNVQVRLSPLRDGRKGGLMNEVSVSGGQSFHGAPNAFACEASRGK